MSKQNRNTDPVWLIMHVLPEVSAPAERKFETLRVLPAVDKILNGAVHQACLLKKRDLPKARVFLVLDATGEMVEPQEIQSDAAARKLCTEACGVVITISGSTFPRCDESLNSAFHERRRALLERVGETQQQRLERQQARESAGAETHVGGPVLFWKDTDRNGYLSNWASSPMHIGGQEFNCVEQWIMFSKATLMGDDATAQEVLSTPSPQMQKKLGRGVYPWNEGLWKRHRARIQLEGLSAKFEQNPELRSRLLRTFPRPLAEASPSDRIYGIGLAPDDARAQDPSLWRGENLLGRCLEEVRARLLTAHPVQDGTGAGEHGEGSPGDSEEAAGDKGLAVMSSG